MQPYGAELFGNADSRHSFGRDAAAALASARARIAGCIGAAPEEIYFTSGGTEADNWALKGAAFAKGRGRVIVSAVEHEVSGGSAAQRRHNHGRGDRRGLGIQDEIKFDRVDAVRIGTIVLAVNGGVFLRLHGDFPKADKSRP